MGAVLKMNVQNTRIHIPSTNEKCRKALRQHYISFRRMKDTGEYRVNFLHGPEDTAYYATDRDDAFLTGLRMATEQIENNPYRCPTCGQPVKTIFAHVSIACRAV